MFKRGVVYYAHLDKRRPVIVVSPELRNARAGDLIVVPLSTHLRYGPWHVIFSIGEGGLAHPSVAKCEQIVTLTKETLEEKPLGREIAAQKMHEIERAVMRALGIVI